MIEEIISFISKFTDFKIPGKIRLTTDDNQINIPIDNNDIINTLVSTNTNNIINKNYKPNRNTVKYVINSEFIILEMYSVHKNKDNVIYYKLVSCETGRIINITKQLFDALYKIVE
jgi:hypothetical protein